MVRLALFFGAILVAVVLMVSILYFHDHVAPKDPTSAVELTGNHLGRVWLSEQYECRPVIENRLDKAVFIKQIEASCACIRVLPNKLKLRPHSKSHLNLILNLRPRPIEGVIPQESRFSSALYPVMTGTSPQRPWAVTAKVRSIFRRCPRFVNLGTLPSHDYDSQQAVISFAVTTYQNIDRLECTEESGAFSAFVRREGNNRSAYQVVVRRTGVLLPGFFEIPIRLTARSRVLPKKGVAISVLLSGKSLADVNATPSVVSLGYCWVGQTIQEECMLHSVHDIPFSTGHVTTESQGPRISIQARVSPLNSFTTRCCLKITPVAEGEIRCVVAIPIKRRGRSDKMTIRIVGHALRNKSKKETL